MNKEDSEKLVTVLRTGHQGIVAVAKSILDEAEIKYLVKGEGLQNLFGVGVMGTGFNLITGPIEIQVLPEDAEAAQEILKDIEESEETEEEYE